MIKDWLIILPSFQDWNWQCDYEKQTAKLLSETNQVVVLLLGTRWQLHQWVWKGIKSSHWSLLTQESRFCLFRPVDLLPLRRFSFIVTINQWSVNLQLKYFTAFSKLFKQGKRQLLWFFWPHGIALIRQLPNIKTLYDCVDFYHFEEPVRHQTFQRYEKMALSSADLVTVNSHALYKHHYKKRPDIVEVSQGFRLERYRKSAVKCIDHHPGSVIGFIGRIDFRFDYDLLVPLVEGNPQWQFVFVGAIDQTYNDERWHFSAKISKLRTLPNTSFMGPTPASKIPSIINTFDVATIPYNLKQDFNRYSYPMKLMEYFYMGKPVVSTPIEELKRFPKFVKTGNSTKAWEQHIKSLLAKPWPKSYQEEQRKLAEANSWESKIEAISRTDLF